MGSTFELNRISAAIDLANAQQAEAREGEFRSELAEMYKVLASTPDSDFEANMVSLSNVGSTQLIKSLQPVSLEPKLYSAFNAFFFRKSRASILELFKELSEVTNSLNVLFTFMRRLLENGRTLFAMESNKPQWTARIQEMAADAIRFREILQTEADGSSPLTASMYSLIGAMMAGNKHSVTPSTTYAGGVDVNLLRSTHDSILMCSDLGYGDYLESNRTQMGYDSNKLQSYSTNTSLAVIKAARGILATLFGASAEYASFEPQRVNLPLYFDFTELQSILEKELGVDLGVNFFDNITFGSDGKTFAERFCRLTLVLHAESMAGEALSKEYSDLLATNPPEELLNSETLLKKRVQDNVTEEASLLNRKVGSTITFTFDKPTAAFITQTEKSEQLNYTTFDNWFSIWASQYLRKKGTSAKNALTDGRMKIRNIPRYVLPVSKMAAVTDARKASGMSVESTRANEDGLYVAPDGTLAYLPTAADRSKVTGIQEFERLGNEVGKIAAQYGISSSLFSEPYDKLARYGIPYNVYQEVQENWKKLIGFEDSLLSYDWDYGLRVYASGRPGIVRCRQQIGAVKPDALTIADYLGYNMAKEGEAPMQKSFADALALMTHADPLGMENPPSFYYGSSGEPGRFIKDSLFHDIFLTYFFHAYKNEVPGLQELITRAFNDLGIQKLDEETPRRQDRIYKGLLSETGEIKGAGRNQDKDIELLQELISRTTDACSGKSGSWVYNDVRESGGADMDYFTTNEQIADHEDYFVPDRSPAHHFARLFNFIGGNVLKQILDGINSLTVEQLTSGEKSMVTEENIAEEGQTPKMVKRTALRPNSGTILDKVKPIAIVFGKYAQNYEAIEAEAEEGIKSIERDTSVGVEDIHFAGSTEKFSVFPHQLDTHRFLRKKEPPKFAVLDIAPGGGKTSIGLGDMACIIKDLQSINKKVKPLVLCPDGLILNWCDDMRQFAGDTWNMIPINGAIFNRWGADRLQEIIATAPPNTICVAGFNFLRNNKMSVVIGNAVIDVGTNLEFIKAFKFNYVIIDESHKLKGQKTAKHKVVKQLTTASFIDYLRIATGTLIADRVTDIEGQVALYSPHIFRKGELAGSNLAEALEETLTLGDDSVQLWKVNTPQRARQRLSRYAAVVTKKKKEWAFMLPSPIEEFHAVKFHVDTDPADEQRKGELHRQLYDLVVDESVEELQKLVAAAKKRTRSADEDEDDDDDGDDGESSEDGERSQDMELGDEDELGMLDADLVKAYLQRIERLIIAPEQDQAFGKIFGAYGIKKYTSRKANVIAGIVKDHFNPPEWDPGVIYTEYQLVARKGDLYLARKQDQSSYRRALLPRDTMGKRPEDNNDIWKKEPPGKVIIFCRYTNSVNAVYDALPEKYKAMAVKFTGKEVDKWGNLNAFKSDPKVKILIANEMGMSEGHNLQIASRLIRVESPWGPGELDQSASRIFRPDPKGAAEGEIYREVVFLDWVLADNTMEVPKQARLIAKVFNKTRFDEAENPLYNDVLGKNALPEVSLSITNVLQERPSLHDFQKYVNSYAQLNGIMRAEFHEMRVTQPAEMLPVPQTPVIEGSAQIKTPFVSAQNIKDPNGWKPLPLSKLLRDPEGQPYVDNPQSLVGQPMITDMGNGMVVSVKVRYVGTAKEGVVNKDRPISSLQIKLKETGELVTFNDMGIVYAPTVISKKAIEQNFAVSLAYRKADIARAERAAKDQELLDQKEAAKEARRNKRETRQANVRVRSIDAGEKRSRNIKEGKPVNQGVKYDPGMKIPTTVRREDEETEDTPLKLAPAYYHGFLTLETDDLDYTKALKKFKFKEIGEYAFITVKRRDQANKVMDYIEDNFHLSDQTIDRLDAFFKTFAKGRRGLYQMELASQHELPHFFATRKQMVKDRKEVRIYPFFMEDKVMLVVDVATSPIIKKHIGKAIEGAATKWQLSPGALMYFPANKADLNAKVKELKAAGINIAEPDVLKAEIAEIKFRAAKKRN